MTLEILPSLLILVEYWVPVHVSVKKILIDTILTERSHGLSRQYWAMDWVDNTRHESVKGEPQMSLKYEFVIRLPILVAKILATKFGFVPDC